MMNLLFMRSTFYIKSIYINIYVQRLPQVIKVITVAEIREKNCVENFQNFLLNKEKYFVPQS